MTNPFEILTGFLERFDAEVQGRDAGDPPADVLPKLRALARGELPASERASLMVQLDEHPGWIRCLSEEIKALRANPGSKK
jgi:hypothetical protein